MNFSDERTLQRIRESDIIIGVNKATGWGEVFYGRSLLLLATEQNTLDRCTVAHFALDYTSDEPARLAAAVLTVKGSCDTRRGGEDHQGDGGIGGGA